MKVFRVRFGFNKVALVNANSYAEAEKFIIDKHTDADGNKPAIHEIIVLGELEG